MKKCGFQIVEANPCLMNTTTAGLATFSNYPKERHVLRKRKTTERSKVDHEEKAQIAKVLEYSRLKFNARAFRPHSPFFRQHPGEMPTPSSTAFSRRTHTR